jgi:hypothetical protein
MASEFGLPRQAVSAFSGKGRAYFLTRLVKEVIFGEAALVGLDPKVERRLLQLRHLRRLGRGAADPGRRLVRQLHRQPRPDRLGAPGIRHLQSSRSPQLRRSAARRTPTCRR